MTMTGLPFRLLNIPDRQVTELIGVHKKTRITPHGHANRTRPLRNIELRLIL